MQGGFSIVEPFSRLWHRWPGLNKAKFQFGELGRMIFFTTATRETVMTVLGQRELSSFNDLGMRVWAGRDQVLTLTGSNGVLFRSLLLDTGWYQWLSPPRCIYCFTNPDTGMTTFDPFRFMLRHAYEEQTDLRMYLTPLHASIRQLLIALGLRERYDFWVKELVRINDEEATRAGRPPLPLWDFSDSNTITSEPVPARDNEQPMRWYWEHSHYRKASGDLILDRIFGNNDSSRALPADFGVRLTAANIDAHIANSKAGLADWATNNELAAQVVQAAKNPKALNRQAEATCW